MEKGTKITLCGQHTWCPVVEYDGEKVTILDDYGNKIQMSPDNWNALVKKVYKGELHVIS